VRWRKGAERAAQHEKRFLFFLCVVGKVHIYTRLPGRNTSDLICYTENKRDNRTKANGRQAAPAASPTLELTKPRDFIKRGGEATTTEKSGHEKVMGGTA
jgi:hypothetical protein